MSKENLKVKAAFPDRPVPMVDEAGHALKRRLDKAGKETTVIRADAPVEVPNIPYYRRRLKAGDLVLVGEKKGKE